MTSYYGILDGKAFVKESTKAYTHVIVAQDKGGDEYKDVAWCGTPELAHKYALKAMNSGEHDNVTIVPLKEGIPPEPKTRRPGRARGFQKGSGSYTCQSCGKKTRETGDCESGVRLCAACFWQAGEENSISDGNTRCVVCGNTTEFDLFPAYRTVRCKKCGHDMVTDIPNKSKTIEIRSD
jgi:hypothetical protein